MAAYRNIKFLVQRSSCLCYRMFLGGLPLEHIWATQVSESYFLCLIQKLISYNFYLLVLILFLSLKHLKYAKKAITFADVSCLLIKNSNSSHGLISNFFLIGLVIL